MRNKTENRHATDFQTLAGMVNSQSGDWIAAGDVENAHRTGEPLSYYTSEGKLAKTVTIRNTPPGTMIGDIPLDGSDMKLQAHTELFTDSLSSQNAKRSNKPANG